MSKTLVVASLPINWVSECKRELPRLRHLFSGATRFHLTQLAVRLFGDAFPVVSPIAGLYRRTILKKTRVIAVVGSYGKTTTRRAVSSALGIPRPKGTLGNHGSFLALTLFRADRSYPYAVLEAGIDDFGQMASYARMLRPDIAIVTSIGSEHHRSLKTLENTRREKSHIVASLPKAGLAILNGDDPNVSWMRGLTTARVVTFGYGLENDIRVLEAQLDWPRGTMLSIDLEGLHVKIKSQLIGHHMAYPMLAALAVARYGGFDLQDAVQSLERLAPTHSRLQPVNLPSGATLIRDEFKSSFETFTAALDTFERIPGRRKIAVIGDVSEPPGSQSEVYGSLGARVGQIADLAMIVAQGRSFQRYKKGIREAGRKVDIICTRHVAEAAEILEGELRPGDLVLLKGRDTQKLDRIALRLQGRVVACALRVCSQKIRCEQCPLL